MMVAGADPGIVITAKTDSAPHRTVAALLVLRISLRIHHHQGGPVANPALASLPVRLGQAPP